MSSPQPELASSASSMTSSSSSGVEARAANENLLWRPHNTSSHHLELFRQEVNRKYDQRLETYADLHRWSVDHYEKFWETVWHYTGVKCSRQPDHTVNRTTPMDCIPRWFPGAKLNYAENLLRHADDDKLAFYYTSERVQQTGVRSKTFGQVRARVAFIARALKSMGVKAGDRVVGYLPNFPETVEVMAATASLGAIWSSTSPDFGVAGVLDRFRQIRPKVIFSVEAVSYNLKTHSHLGKLKEVVDGLGDVLEKVVVIPFCHDEKDVSLAELGDKACFFSQFVGPEEGVEVPELEYVQVPFHHPLFIMYSSGTTGAPKCMVHSVGGTLLKHLEEHQIQGNRSDRDVLMYYTTTGWMMWNWMVSALALGTTLVLYDGSPMLPHPSAMWDLVDQCGITVFGTSAKWIAVQEDRGVKPRVSHKLTTLKAICSTGSPLSPHSYDYVYRDIKTNVLLASISGGTDIIACFMGENSVLPVYRGEIQSAHLGCAVECWNESAEQLEGESGELVVTKPFPSMPVDFWADPGGKMYRAAYFDKYPGHSVWAHGDFILINPETKGMLMLGRSDGTLNPNGVRFGSAEIYSVVEAFAEEGVADSLCVGQRNTANEERVILFLKMADGVKFSEKLADKIRARIRSLLSARHVPALILPVKDIPYTINGKKVEVAVKKILNNQAVKNAGSLANPESLELYRNIPETQKW